MVKLNIKELLDKNGRTKYWLTKKLETDHKFATKLIENKTTAMSFEMMEKLCVLFECEPGDLFKRED